FARSPPHPPSPPFPYTPPFRSSLSPQQQQFANLGPAQHTNQLCIRHPGLATKHRPEITRQHAHTVRKKTALHHAPQPACDKKDGVVTHEIGTPATLDSGGQQSFRRSFQPVVHHDQLANRPRLPTQHAGLDLVQTIPTHAADETSYILKTLFAVNLGGPQRMSGSAFLLRQHSILESEADAAGDAKLGVFCEGLEGGFKKSGLERKVAIQFYEEFVVDRPQSVNSCVHEIHDVTSAPSSCRA